MTTIHTSSADNPIATLTRLLQLWRVKVTPTSLKGYLEGHPDYPSLKSLSDACRKFNIENAALQLQAYQLFEIPTPFIAHTRPDGGIFVTVTSISAENVSFYDGIKSHNQTFANFTKAWSGIVFLVEPSENSGEANYIKKRTAEQIQTLKTPFVLFVGLLLWGWQMYNAPTLLGSFFVFLHGIGFILSTLLVSVSIGQSSALAKKLCQLSVKTDCQNLLQSSASKVTNWLTWAEVGILYFSPLLALPLYATGGVYLTVSGVLFALWSVYYQWQVAKIWCPLCLGVVSVLVLEFATLLFAPPLNGAGNYVELLLWLTVTVGLWLFLKPVWVSFAEVEGLRKKLHKFANNVELFRTVLHQQPIMPPISTDLQPITIGNPQALHSLVMVTNPFCEPCANMHTTIEALVAENPKLNGQIIFAASNQEADKRGMVARHILTLPNTQQAQALHEWYEYKGQGTAKWREKWAVSPNEETKFVLEQHDTWCYQAKVEVTPTFYFDGYKLPEIYRLEDLGHFLDYLPNVGFANQQ